MDGKIDWNDIVTSKRIAYSNPSYASCRAGEKIGFTYGVVINDPLRTQRVKTIYIRQVGIKRYILYMYCTVGEIVLL